MKVLCYTSPGRGHLYPTMSILRELRRRGHDVVLYTLRDEVARAEAAGIRARPIAAAIEAIEHDDYAASSPTKALDRAVRIFVARGEHEIRDLQQAITEQQADVLLVDFNCWGAAAAAEASGVPWALFMPYFLPWNLPGLPPFGPGLTPRDDLAGRIRDAIMRRLVHGVVDRNLPALNALRAKLGLVPLEHMTDYGRSAPRVLYYTAEPFDYPCAARPANVVSTGPGLWEPEIATPEWLQSINQPLVLVTCSTEYQADGKLVSCALEALADEDVFVVATTAAVDPAQYSATPNSRVERFVPHGPLLRRAVCVICHGGMGITQKALAAAVPVVVVPFGRDQLEVARHVVVARAGVRIAPKRLSAQRIRRAVRTARTMRAGAEKVAQGFRAAGGAQRAVDEIEALARAGAIGRERIAVPAAPTLLRVTERLPTASSR